VGTLMLAIAMQREAATAAALYYIIHSTLVTGALFLIADLIGKQRGKAEDRYVIARNMNHSTIIGIVFFIAALTVVGMPPLSGFAGKILILQAAQGMTEIAWVWPAVLLAGLASLVAISRAGTTLFWRSTGDANVKEPISRLKLTAIGLLLCASPLLVVFGGAVTDYTSLAAAQLHDSSALIDAVTLRGDQ
jgi:multicomponent K+:H+ antiporter subunit D